MRQECVEAVSQALGRAVNQKEARDIESRILRAMRQRSRPRGHMRGG